KVEIGSAKDREHPVLACDVPAALAVEPREDRNGEPARTPPRTRQGGSRGSRQVLRQALEVVVRLRRVRKLHPLRKLVECQTPLGRRVPQASDRLVTFSVRRPDGRRRIGHRSISPRRCPRSVRITSRSPRDANSAGTRQTSTVAKRPNARTRTSGAPGGGVRSPPQSRRWPSTVRPPTSTSTACGM